ncbi:cytochrome P450 [Microdochium bolleyi]|uniref:Cytochrome P450 n=1 Tax=Microdochium bolleyi TaxID=196109 RepID=A0A136JCQ3_9PEZI|nr:cytochrome P450 [Microdochium bolleyi]
MALADSISVIAQSSATWLADFRTVASTWSYAKIFGVVSAVAAIHAISRAVYLTFFHPLSKFPGPRIAAVSNIYYAVKWLSGRYPMACQKLFEQYGPVVRIAPNELVFSGTQSYYDIHASAVRNRETFVKTKFQDIGEKEPGVTAERDPEVHREVARKLRPAFSPRSLKAQEPTLNSHVDELIDRINTHGTTGRGINFLEWMDRYSWDVAANMAYGREFHQVRDTKTSSFLQTFQRVGPLGTVVQVFSRFPLLRPLGLLFVPPSVVKTLPTLLRMNRQEVRSRMARKDNLLHPDYMQHLVPEEKSEGGGPVEEMPTEDWLVAQANVLVLAGFDPLTNVMVAVMYYLCRSPDKLRRLTEEIRGAFTSYSDINVDALQSFKYLQAVLEECLRIHTNAAFGLPRLCPGATIDGYHVPEGTVVQTCHYATTHDEKNFAMPYEFHPERFLPETHPLYDARFSNDNKKAFVPFSSGPRGCPGYNAAYMQLRLTLAKMFWTFDVELTNGDTLDWERDLRMYAVWIRPEVWVRFTKVQ